MEVPFPTEHRPKGIRPIHRWNAWIHGDEDTAQAAVVKPYKLKEITHIPEAQTAIVSEWDKLESTGPDGRGAWDHANPREKQDVIDQAYREGWIVHFAWLFEIRGLKGSELAK